MIVAFVWSVLLTGFGTVSNARCWWLFSCELWIDCGLFGGLTLLFGFGISNFFCVFAGGSVLIWVAYVLIVLLSCVFLLVC